MEGKEGNLQAGISSVARLLPLVWLLGWIGFGLYAMRCVESVFCDMNKCHFDIKQL